MIEEIIFEILKEAKKKKLSLKEIERKILKEIKKKAKGKVFKLSDPESLEAFIIQNYIDLHQEINFEPQNLSLKAIKEAIKSLEDKSSSLEEKKKALIFLGASGKEIAFNYLNHFKEKSFGLLKVFSIIAFEECAFFTNKKTSKTSLDNLLNYKEQKEVLRELFPFEFCNRRCENCPYKLTCTHFQDETSLNLSMLSEKEELKKALVEFEMRYLDQFQIIYQKNKSIKVKLLREKDEPRIKKAEQKILKDSLFKNFEEVLKNGKTFCRSLIRSFFILGKEEDLDEELEKMIHYWMFSLTKLRKILFDYHYQKEFFKKDEKVISHLIAAANFLKNLSLYLIYQENLEKKVRPFIQIEGLVLRTHLKDFAQKIQKKFPEAEEYLDKIFIN